MASAIARLNDFGQSPWYDNLARTLLQDGGLEQLIDDDGIKGVTSNPTIFDKAMAAGEGYDEQLKECAAKGLSIEDSYWALVVQDVGNAADLLRPVYDATGGADGFVSVEVSPELAHDTDATIAQAKELFGRLGRPNVMIKIPATLEGLPAIQANVGAGINTNVTLIFSLARHDAVIDAYLAGLEKLVGDGGDPSTVSSVASFFVSRVDTETDRRLPDDSPLRGKAAVANAKLAYRLFQQRFSGDRWDALAAKGARLQRPLWASTSTKNPAYSTTLYVDDLIGQHTVNTLAPASIDALHQGDGNMKADTVTKDVAAAEQVMTDLAAAGVDFDDVTATLEREGVESFAGSFNDALATLGEAPRRGDLSRPALSLSGSGGLPDRGAQVRRQVVDLHVRVDPTRVRHEVRGHAGEAVRERPRLRRADRPRRGSRPDPRSTPLAVAASGPGARGAPTPDRYSSAVNPSARGGGALHEVGHAHAVLGQRVTRITVACREPRGERGRPEAVARAREADTTVGRVLARVQPADEDPHARIDEVGQRAPPGGRQHDPLTAVVGALVHLEARPDVDVGERVGAPLGEEPPGELVVVLVDDVAIGAEPVDELGRRVDLQRRVQVHQGPRESGASDVEVAGACPRASERRRDGTAGAPGPPAPAGTSARRRVRAPSSRRPRRARPRAGRAPGGATRPRTPRRASARRRGSIDRGPPLAR